jgi:putative hydrolase of the HAD superfamily
MEFAYDAELVEAGHRAGLATLDRDGLADPDALAARVVEHIEPLFLAPGRLEEVDYPGLIREQLGQVGIEVSDEELMRYLQAEHAAWAGAFVLGSTTHALLDALRNRGLKLGLVSNAFDPREILQPDLERMGVAERLDFAVFSSEVGRRKPDPAIFRVALAALQVEPEETVFVGDRLYEDVRGAGELGMTTVQALWFRADEHAEGGEPDYLAFTQMDVLNFVDRLRD